MNIDPRDCPLCGVREHNGRTGEVQVIAYHIDVPEDLVAVLIEDDWLAACDEHGLEVAAGRSPEAFEERVTEMAGAA